MRFASQASLPRDSIASPKLHRASGHSYTSLGFVGSTLAPPESCVFEEWPALIPTVSGLRSSHRHIRRGKVFLVPSPLYCNITPIPLITTQSLTRPVLEHFGHDRFVIAPDNDTLPVMTLVSLDHVGVHKGRELM